MDQYYDRFNSELAYDRVSNLINTSIQSYKNGKDEYLLGGQSDLDEKNDTTKRFYDKITDKIVKTTGSSSDWEKVEKGTSIGIYAFNEQNDAIELPEGTETFESVDALKENIKSLELKDKTYDILKTESIEILKTLIDRCKIFHNANNKLIKSLSSNDLNIEITQELKSSKVLVKDILSGYEPEVRQFYMYKFPKDEKISNILKEALNIIKISDNNYLGRYNSRYKLVEGINGITADMCRDAIDLSKGNPSAMKKYVRLTDNLIKKLGSCTDPFDPFVLDNARFKANIVGMVLEDEKPVKSDRGVMYKDFLEKNSLSSFETVVSSLVAMDEFKVMKSKLEANPRVGCSIKISKEFESNFDALNIIDDDLTVGELFTKLEEFSNYVEDYQKSSKSNIVSCLKYINKSLEEISDIMRRHIMNIKDMTIKNFKTDRLAISTILHTGMNCVSCNEGLEIMISKDLLYKHQFILLVTELLSNITEMINPKSGDMK